MEDDGSRRMALDILQDDVLGLGIDPQ